jgi:CO dehydrogenase/acetyl-CoA synthase beta subunit
VLRQISIYYGRKNSPKELIKMLELEQFRQEIEILGKDIDEMGASL